MKPENGSFGSELCGPPSNSMRTGASSWQTVRTRLEAGWKRTEPTGVGLTRIVAVPLTEAGEQPLASVTPVSS